MINGFSKRLLVGSVIACLFTFVPALINFGYEGANVFILEGKTPEEFVFYQQPIDSIKDTYSIGEAPEFNFIKTYYVSGHIQGENTLRCEGFRSDVFIGAGFIEDDKLNKQLSASDEPFVFGGNLPTFATTCTLRSVITLCHHRFDVCKTVTTDSEQFNFE